LTQPEVPFPFLKLGGLSSPSPPTDVILDRLFRWKNTPSSGRCTPFSFFFPVGKLFWIVGVLSARCLLGQGLSFSQGILLAKLAQSLPHPSLPLFLFRFTIREKPVNLFRPPHCVYAFFLFLLCANFLGFSFSPMPGGVTHVFFSFATVFFWN